MILAQVIPGAVVDPQAAAGSFVDAISSKEWGLAIGAGLMLMVWLLRLIWPSLKSKLLPYVAVAISVAGAIGAVLIIEPHAWLQAILAGIGDGLIASGAWGLTGVFRKKEEPPKP